MTKQLWKYEPTDRWIRGKLNGETVVDSKSAMLMIENPGEVDYYFPKRDIQVGALIPSDHVETSGYRGEKEFWHLKANEDVVENAVWTYAPKDGRPDFGEYVAVKWHALDQWFEEDEEVYYHARNPYHRVDTIKSSRHVEVFVDGVKVADTKRPYLLFETSIQTRYYIPEEDVDFTYLTPTDSHTICPYKGEASYYSVVVNDETYEDVVWTYPNPIPEAPKLKGQLSFWAEKDKRIQIIVDGEPI